MNIDHALRNALEKEEERVSVMKKRENRRRHRKREEKARGTHQQDDGEIRRPTGHQYKHSNQQILSENERHR